MFKGKRICFGYGDVLVRSRAFSGEVKLIEIKPPVLIGSTPRKGTYTELQEISFVADEKYFNYITLIKKRIIIEFEVGDYIFDFSNYNAESLNTLSRGIFNALYGNGMCLAC